LSSNLFFCSIDLRRLAKSEIGKDNDTELMYTVFYVEGREAKMSLGLVLLLGFATAVYFGLAHRILDRMRLTDVQALIFIAVMVAGGFVTLPIPAGQIKLSLNLGGMVVPVVLSLYLLSKADKTWEWVRALLASVGTAAAIWLISARTDFGPEAGSTVFLDPVWLYSLIAGLIAYLLGRSRRAAFIAGTLGVVLADLLHLAQLMLRRSPGVVALGGAGVFDATVLAGFIAVGLAELVGETRERLQGGPELGDDRPLALRQDEGVREDDGRGDDL
jgi:uncharacterized membrane protein